MTQLIALVALVLAAQAESRTVLGSSEAQACFELAETDMDGRASSVRTCREALSGGGLSMRDRAATQVNLGILLRRAGRLDAALAAHDRAAELAPDLAEVYANRGVVHLAARRPHAAVADFNRALALEPAEPHLVRYNRARAHEWLEDYPAAYADYRRAAALAPDWDLPRIALERFEVSREPEG
ncbi:hypothetical protein DDZ18_11330 [Marinicauda salina]|uniref:Uncharacterized protein n=1 Tax=Marinicauda salina TaxID=2135793 RepID=A0A2U2BS22_9PROT|nr:tetratricopeptide repeat protein [Marinicauda salina]PWE16782.1 hypothetical protein DDZ18_11330 [Marinicauda salina]